MFRQNSLPHQMKNSIRYVLEVLLSPLFVLIALLCRFSSKKIEIGLGPEPLINNIYHKKALELYGYKAHTFVSDVYFITDEFDLRADQILSSKFHRLRSLIIPIYLWIISITHYQCIYIYFSGGPLGFTPFLWRMEPLLYRLAKVKVVVMPYGGDVHDLSRSPNLLFKNAMARDYPKHSLRRRQIASKIDLWTKHADHIIGGCDWVYYMYYWDTLLLGHFSIDVDIWKPYAKNSHEVLLAGKKIRILHAPNHRMIKGTQFFIDAVNELIQEGMDLELVLLENVPNEEVREAMASVDIVADQLIIGWYAMFALEAMAMEKPVLCFLHEDLKKFYSAAGLVSIDEIPIINCSPLTVKEVIRKLASDPGKIKEIGLRSRRYVIKHHSIQAVGKTFDRINRGIGLEPRGRTIN